MSRRWLYGLTGALAALLAAPLALGWALSQTSACGDAKPLLTTDPLMKAAVHRCYGPPSVLRVEQVLKPTAGPGEVLVKVRAASLNPLDLHRLRGTPYPIRLLTGIGAPSDIRSGIDFAGTVAAVGPGVKRFKVGDEVFGAAAGTLAEYVAVAESGTIAAKPPAASFDEAAAVPVAAMTALQALQDLGGVQRGDKVLVNGASGGVGTFAITLARSFKAEVTGVCSTRNIAMVRGLGADHVIDYTQVDFTQGTSRYDLILDTVGNHSLGDLQRVLKPQGTLIMIGGPKGDWLGPIGRRLHAALVGSFSSRRLLPMSVDLKQEDLQSLSDLLQAGRLKPFIERIYPLERLPDAMAYLETGHARGKVVIEVP